MNLEPTPGASRRAEVFMVEPVCADTRVVGESQQFERHDEQVVGREFVEAHEVGRLGLVLGPCNPFVLLDGEDRRTVAEHDPEAVPSLAEGIVGV